MAWLLTEGGYSHKLRNGQLSIQNNLRRHSNCISHRPTAYPCASYHCTSSYTQKRYFVHPRFHPQFHLRPNPTSRWLSSSLLLLLLSEQALATALDMVLGLASELASGSVSDLASGSVLDRAWGKASDMAWDMVLVMALVTALDGRLPHPSRLLPRMGSHWCPSYPSLHNSYPARMR